MPVLNDAKELLDNYKNAISKKTNFLSSSEKNITRFNEQQNDYYKNLVSASLRKLKNSCLESSHEKENAKIANEILSLLEDFEKNYKTKTEYCISILVDIVENAERIKTDERLLIRLPKVPDEIKDDLYADLDEMQKCFNAGCYRSAVILCGRILETCLHRKYYEVTGVDIMEKHPEIGLGNLIAKLAEKNVEFDPGLTQQIHLINQVRIFSVHKKKTAFYPSKEQCKAIILYTMEILKKMFR